MVKPNRELINKLLKLFKDTQNPEIRNELIMLYLPFVNAISEKIHSRLPQTIELDDLKSAGLFGLMHAINAFDSSKGVQFETYCAFRIRGSILDELRALDWVPRVVRAKSQKLTKAFNQLSAEKGREPTDSELAEFLDITLPKLDVWVKEASITTILPFHANASNDLEENRLGGEEYEDKAQLEPYKAIFKEELLDYITQSLTQKERILLVLYYFEELTMKEIGKSLSISESRVSQIHSNILFRLKAQFEKIKLELLS